MQENRRRNRNGEKQPMKNDQHVPRYWIFDKAACSKEESALRSSACESTLMARE